MPPKGNTVSIRIDDNTRKALLEIAARMQSEKLRAVSINDAMWDCIKKCYPEVVAELEERGELRKPEPKGKKSE